MGVRGRGSSTDVPGPVGGWGTYNTINELQAEAGARFPGANINLSGMSPANARIILEEYERFQHQYSLSPVNIAPGSNALLSTSTIGEHTTINYNTGHLVKPLNIINQRVASNQVLVEQNLREAVRHEMYHALHHQMTPAQKTQMNTFLSRVHREAVIYEETHGRPLISTYSMNPGGQAPYTELHSELAVLLSQGRRTSYTRELRTLYKELF